MPPGEEKHLDGGKNEVLKGTRGQSHHPALGCSSDLGWVSAPGPGNL